MIKENTPTGFETMSAGIETAYHYNKWVFSKLKKYIGRKILEVGPGYGNLSRYITKFDNYVLVDINESVINRAREKDDKRTYFILDASSKDFSKILDKMSFDTVLCVNVLEHIIEHEAAFRNMVDVLEPGGKLLLFVPAFSFLYNEMDKLAGHQRRYTRKSCMDLNRVGTTKIIRFEYFNPVGAIGWFFNRFLNHKDLSSIQINRQVKLFDTLFIHFSKVTNPLTKYFIGQSLICVFKKK